MKLRFAFLLAATFALSQQVIGQLPVSGGDRVRLAYKDGRRVTGFVDSISPDGLRLRPDYWTESLFIKSDAVATLERSAGKHRRFWRNLGLTMGIAGLGAGVIAAASYSPCTDTGFLACFMAPASPADAFAMGFTIGAAVALPVGLIIGAGAKHERWTAVSPVRSGDALTLRPIVGRRYGLAASIPIGHRRN